MELSKLASAIYNDIQAGLSGMNANPTISLDQLEDECVEVRQTVIKELYLKNLLYPKDLMIAINCVEVDCKDQNKCPICIDVDNPKMAKHFEIPQLIDGLGASAISFIGSTDREQSYKVYFSKDAVKFNKYKRRKQDKPYVYIEKTPNENGMYDGWIFNAPFVQYIAVIGIFKDLRQLEQFNCCNSPEFLDFGFITTDVKNRLTEKKLKLYRQYVMPPHPTDLTPR